MKERDHPLLSMYHALFRCFGPQRWWPGRTPFEVMVGAILTQNTNWGNVEKAIVNLRSARLLTPAAMARVSVNRLAELIRPAGYYNIKSARLKNFTGFFMSSFGGRILRMAAEETALLRAMLLAVNGIGEETADSILLYALDKPVFVVDAYTKRIFSRHGFFREDSAYAEVQAVFTAVVDPGLYNEYHALIVRLGKEYCRKGKPRCEQCPLRGHTHI